MREPIQFPLWSPGELRLSSPPEYSMGTTWKAVPDPRLCGRGRDQGRE